MAVLRKLVKQTLSAILPERWWLTQGPRRSGGIALTFDDGPDPVRTPQVLDHLKQFNLQATFFVVGFKAAQNPEIIRRMVDEGHQIANHTYFHGEPSETPANQFVAETTACQSLLTRLTGGPVTCFRPPKGELGFRKLLGLWQLKQTVILWNIDSRDFTFSTPSEFDAWSQRYAPAPGDIVLMHDDRAVTAAALPSLLSKIRERRLKCVRVSDWCGQSTPVQHSLVHAGA